MSLFIDHTKRSASELLADLSACRQFRHMSRRYHMAVIERAFQAVAKDWQVPRSVKHPDRDNPCTNCGRPRSKFNLGRPGLCYRCYASDGKNIRELWVEDVFMTAILMRGFSCDACDAVTTPGEEESRNAAIKMLENMDGAVKPVLCPHCETNFKQFCSTNYGKGAWRMSPDRDVEKMTLAWLAQKVKVLAEAVRSAA